MVNVLVPIVDSKQKFNDILNRLAKQSDINIVVGITEDLYSDILLKVEESENITFLKFQKGSKREAIINALQKYVEEGSILIMRKPITVEEFNSFVTSKQDVITCRREYGKFKNILFLIWQKLLRLFLGLNEYIGDSSVIYLGEDVSSIMTASGNFSFSSRVNRWRGIEQGTVYVKGDSVKPEHDMKDITKYIIFVALSILIAVVVTTCVCVFTKVSIIVGLLLVCLDVICVSITAISAIIIAFNFIVGKKNYPFALRIDDFGNQDEMKDIDKEDYLVKEDL